MSQHKEIYFKIERLNANDEFLEEKSVQLIDGNVNVSYSDVCRRSCSFTLREPLPTDWMSSRWKMYYGVKESDQISYEPIGVFIPLNPEESEELSGWTTDYQGVDKAQILSESFSEIPLTFTAGTTLKEVATTIFNMIGETKLNLADVPYSLATEFTFEEGISLEHILSTLVRSFPADWYYDRNGIAVLEALPLAQYRPIKYSFKEDNDSIHIDTKRSIDTDKYYNRVVLVGGKADTGIFRQVYGNDVHRYIAGRWVTKFFKEDAATSQEQVNQLAMQLLDAGIRLPANIVIHNIPIADLEPKQIIMHNNTRYEVIDFNIPLDLSLQTIQAGEVIV